MGSPVPAPVYEAPLGPEPPMDATSRLNVIIEDQFPLQLPSTRKGPPDSKTHTLPLRLRVHLEFIGDLHILNGVVCHESFRLQQLWRTGTGTIFVPAATMFTLFAF